MQSDLGVLVAMALAAAACSTNMVTVGDAEPTELPGGWEVVDHPVVVAVRGSSSIEPASRVLDGSEDTGWSSGDSAAQWIEFDLGEPKHIEWIRLMVDQTPAGFTVHEVRAGAHDNPGRLADALEGDTQGGDWLQAEVGYQAEFIRITTKESPSLVAWKEIQIETDQ